jgi:hypothetical protein
MAMLLGISNANAWLVGLELSHQRDTFLLLLSPEGDTSLPVCVSLMALTLVKFRETRSDWHDICATNLELLNSA